MDASDASGDAGQLTDTGRVEDVGVPADVGVDAAGLTPECDLTGYPSLDVAVLRASGAIVTALALAPGRNDVFIAEQTGRVWILDAITGTVGATPFLDLRATVGTLSATSEQGLVGLAFHPDYATNGLFYVAYTPTSVVENRIAVGHAGPIADVADGTVTTILAIADYAANNNGGQLVFGPDGYLYVATGDGGGGIDPRLNGQNIEQLLGKILRLDVTATAYSVPSTNPFFGATPGRDEIWAFGFRNPWRISFDRSNGNMFIADVGQSGWEEIDVAPAGTGAGDNFGWSLCEGNHDRGASGACATVESHHAPVFEYGHEETSGVYGASVTGGFVYRGAAIPGLVGAYVFGDATRDMVAAFRYCDGAVRDVGLLPGASACAATTFGEDAAGELLIGCADGRVLRIVGG